MAVLVLGDNPLEGTSCLLSQLMMIMIKVSDISNEARPMDVAEPWLDCLLQEFFNQVNIANFVLCWKQYSTVFVLTNSILCFYDI